MSYYETPEARMRRQITSLEAQNNKRQQEIERMRQQFEREQSEAAARIEDAKRRNDALANEVRNSQRVSNALRVQMEQQYIQHRQELVRLQQEEKKRLAAMQNQMDQQRAETATQISRTRTQLQQQIQLERQRTDASIQALEAQQIADRKRHEQQVQVIRSQIQTLQQAEAARAKTDAERRELARYWLEQTQRLRADLQDNYRPEKFEAAAWSHLDVEIANAKSDLEGNRLETAISNGRQAFQSAMALRDTLAPQVALWDQTLAEVRAQELALVQAAADAEVRTYRFQAGGKEVKEVKEVTDDRGVDYWTYGNLSVLNERIRLLQAEINRNTDDKTQQELESCREQLQSLQQELQLLENAAASNLDMAYRRLEMANRIGEVLGSQFLLQATAGDFFGAQNRDEYHASFWNPTTGENVTVVITPTVNENGVVENHVEVISGIRGAMESKRQQMEQAVTQSLQQQVPDFGLAPCAGRYRDDGKTGRRLGNIRRVTEGKETVRADVPVVKPGFRTVTSALEVNQDRVQECQQQLSGKQP